MNFIKITRNNLGDEVECEGCKEEPCGLDITFDGQACPCALCLLKPICTEPCENYNKFELYQAANYIKIIK